MASQTWEAWVPAPYIEGDPESLFVPDLTTVWSNANLATPAELERVRGMYYLHMARQLGEQRDKAFAWERERTRFAEEWVGLCEVHPDSGLVMPGSNTTTTGRTPEQVREHRVDAARTPQRHLKVGAPLPTWQLLGIECVVCQREGLAFPGGFYVAQQKLL